MVLASPMPTTPPNFAVQTIFTVALSDVFLWPQGKNGSILLPEPVTNEPLIFDFHIFHFLLHLDMDKAVYNHGASLDNATNSKYQTPEFLTGTPPTIRKSHYRSVFRAFLLFNQCLLRASQMCIKRPMRQARSSLIAPFGRVLERLHERLQVKPSQTFVL